MLDDGDKAHLSKLGIALAVGILTWILRDVLVAIFEFVLSVSAVLVCIVCFVMLVRVLCGRLRVRSAVASDREIARSPSFMPPASADTDAKSATRLEAKATTDCCGSSATVIQHSSEAIAAERFDWGQTLSMPTGLSQVTSATLAPSLAESAVEDEDDLILEETSESIADRFVNSEMLVDLIRLNNQLNVTQSHVNQVFRAILDVNGKVTVTELAVRLGLPRRQVCAALVIIREALNQGHREVVSIVAEAETVEIRRNSIMVKPTTE